ncbi:hypothetical protein [Plantactinospora veratri]
MSTRTAARAGTATSTTVTSAPIALETASAARHSRVARVGGGSAARPAERRPPAPSRCAQTAPATVEVAAIQAAQVRLATQAASPLPPAAGTQAMMPSP